MSLKRQLFKTIQKVSKYLSKSFLYAIKKQIVWLLRTLFITKRRRGSVNAGFVLPTVVMVSLVVVLLTTAILFRSFERAKNASNVRVNEVVINAATPAIDRARAKLDALFGDPTLPRGTPSDNALYDAIKKDKYRLGDETRLKLAFDINGDNTIQVGATNNNGTPSDPSDDFIDDDETLKTAWKYAVDTDNNGKKDTLTLYGIYFHTPKTNSSGVFTRERSSLEARTPPMDNDSGNPNCPNATGFSSLVGNSSWYKLNSGNLGKSFFVYTVNVPITQQMYNSLPTSTTLPINSSNSEAYKGNKGVIALEFQQDRTRIPLTNNAVWFDNDLEVIVGSTTLLLNGRVHTNSNLLVGAINSGGNITFRQVSSKKSCFYNQENGQIIVGGNVGNGSLSQTGTQDVTADLYRGFGNAISTTNAVINGTNKSTNSAGGGAIGFNDAAYNQRIARMKEDAIALCTTCNSATSSSALVTAVNGSGYPDEVKRNVASKVQSGDDSTTAKNFLYDEIEIYLRNRTRRVPFAEAASNATPATILSAYTTTITVSLDPPQAWREPLNSSNQFTGATSITVTPTQLRATHPNLQKKEAVQTELGDRVFIGNNLPAKWLQDTQYVGSEANQFISSSGSAVNWTRNGTESQRQRWRNTQIQPLADLGIFNRNGFWEESAAKNPANDLDSIGGVRIITGAGIYVDDGATNIVGGTSSYARSNSFLNSPPAPNPLPPGTPTPDYISVWPDTMPMTSPEPLNTRQGDLLMRATAVYHYKISNGTDQTPIACVSSYYDPTTDVTSKNKSGLPWNAATGGKSNNGIVYDFPGRNAFTTNKALLVRQSKLIFPNGRWANEPLQDALAKIGSGTTVPSTGLQLTDYSAIDTALCAISILDPTTAFVSTPTNQPVHGAIKEATFLDAREAKQIGASSTSTTYDLDLEQRQPLEIRVTDIDLGSIATTAISTEYLLPYSGIIYATREDALRDESDITAQKDLLSPTDFQLDPKRRPNGIRLINGATLARTTTNAFNTREKGLILTTDLPAYIKGNFNFHRTSTSSTTEIEEFTETEPTTNFYDRATPNNSFACRPGRTGCPTGSGDFWRPATIIADSMTLLSDSFQDGFRTEGDYDLNNNTGIAVEVNDTRRQDRLKNGFWENNFATSTDWWQTSGGNKNYPKTSLGSYTANGVTPIQRRVDTYPMYVMEICRQLPVSECDNSSPDLTKHWVIGFDINGDGVLSANSQTYTVNGSNIQLVEKDIKTYQLGQAIAAAAGSTTATTTALSNWTTAFSSAFPSSWYIGSSCSTSGSTTTCSKSIRERLGAGDTGDKQALVATERRYPRRVAFARDNTNNLVQVSSIYKPMGVGCPLDTTGITYANNGCIHATSSLVEGTHYGKKGNSALWFRTKTVSSTDPTAIANASYGNSEFLFYSAPTATDGQPLLVPVLQIHDASNTSSIRSDGTAQNNFKDRWIQQAASTTTNATFVLGNSPARPEETSSGLQNFVRFLENWGSITSKISGSFIQLKRSNYATAPLAPILTAKSTTTATASNNLSFFDYALDTYPTSNLSGLLPFYNPPDRQWGFDVGILSEQPDLFAQRFTSPSTDRPNEYFREVGRDDTWVKTLLCAGEANDNTGTTSGATYTTPAVPNEYRSGCPSIPADS
ncbi:hypothetical protein I8751_22525 [Nostocaceae cyanobacterium CENA357]|uniref:Uncharacterized protein n=1 Tax=Atlanticothrix silvestris CENA357 TaxID=1725252 RepID=A0A8J7HGW8_9CYAN|nr:hormogonium polysaccharide biosynthesis protein HpsA [Atlanticothrix silvestris]MBH8555072.1 hypothetical protein [Atlanticothrix silvestris CENA357]